VRRASTDLLPQYVVPPSRCSVFTYLAVPKTAASVKGTASKGEDGTASIDAAVLTLSRSKRWTFHVVLFFTYLAVPKTTASVKGTASKGEHGTASNDAAVLTLPQ
jgi:hypothetical protein